MAKERLTDALIKKLPAPAKGNVITWDDTVPGFGARVTAAGHRAFVLNYTLPSGRERRYTIGAFPDWRTTTAREEAQRLKASIRATGADPIGDLQDQRGAPTFRDMIRRYVEEHMPTKRALSQRDERSMIGKWLTKGLRSVKVSDITTDDIDALHRKITKAGGPYRANRVVALLSKMFSLSIRWRWRSDNPCAGLRRNPEVKRAKYLTADELNRLTTALAAFPDQASANVIRMLTLTGARRGEVLSMRWADVDLNTGIWTKPGATTKQATEHRVPLSAPARQLLAALPRDGELVFPGRGGARRSDIKKPWAAVCKAAKISGVRVHDLRHTYASVLASSGVNLLTIGALLGHTQPATTFRYAHLIDDPLRSATETAGAVISGSESAEVVRLRRS
jgi:integrase